MTVPSPREEPFIIEPGADGSATARGRELVIGQWPATGVASEVTPLHVHHDDDEARHVICGALRFRLADRELVAEAGSTVLVPAGVAHTFGNAGPEPSRYLIILPTRLDELIGGLHESDPAEHPEIYRRFASELLE
jgi:mannose-6-phosphate isomerase-like protein (cupin superfamily)